MDAYVNYLQKGFISGNFSLVGMLCGTLTLENIKMERQRTNLTYGQIIKNFKSKGITGIYNGLYPWGIINSYSKGIAVGTGIQMFKNYFPNNPAGQLGVGISTGLFEAIFVSPILNARNNSNKNLLEKNSAKINLKDFSPYKGAPLYALRRSADWGSRLMSIAVIEKYFDIDTTNTTNKIMTTFVGSSLTSFITTPIDRFLPLAYTKDLTKKEVLKIVKDPKKLWAGSLFRSLNIGLTSIFIIGLPAVWSNKS